MPGSPDWTLAPVRGGAKKAPRALTLPELRQLRTHSATTTRRSPETCPTWSAFLMATGLRIGEACGLAWNAVDLEAGAIEVRAAAVRVRGQGLVVKSTKTDAGARTLLLPQWCVAMLRERASALDLRRRIAARSRSFPLPREVGAIPPTRRRTFATPSQPQASTG